MAMLADSKPLSSSETQCNIDSKINSSSYAKNTKTEEETCNLVEKSMERQLSGMKLKNLGYPLGYLFSLYCFIVLTSIPLVIWKFGIIGWVLHYPFRYSLTVIDKLTSNASELNKIVFKMNGFDPEKAYTNILIENVIALFSTIPIRVWLSTGVEAHYDSTLVINFTIMFIVSETYFTTVHKIIHNYYPHIHLKHHCCIFPSFMTNLCFDPIDQFLELHGPAIISIFLAYLLDDWFCFILFSCLINAWYVLDHDEYLKLSHYRHHKYVDSNYNIYLNSTQHNPQDKLRKILTKQ